MTLAMINLEFALLLILGFTSFPLAMMLFVTFTKYWANRQARKLLAKRFREHDAYDYIMDIDNRL